jgi:hypothetical protein
MLALIFAFWMSTAAFFYYFPQAIDPPLTQCADLKQGCLLTDTSYRIQMNQQPQKLLPFNVRVTGKAKTVEISLTMKDMDMGVNRYQLTPNSDYNQWQGMMILPACVSGRRDWLALVIIDGKPVGQITFQSLS